MNHTINLYELSVAEVLTLACALLRAIDRHDSLTSLLDARPHSIGDARSAALAVANLAAIEYLEGENPTLSEDEILLQAEILLAMLGVTEG